MRLWLGSLAAFVSAASFALNLVLARVVYDTGGNIHALNLVRPLFFLLAVGLVLVLARKAPVLPVRRRWASLLVGLLLTAELYAILGAIQFMPVSVAVLVNYCYPLLIALATWTLGRGLAGQDRPSWPKALCLFTAFGGLALVLVAPGEAPAPLGLLLAFVSALVMATMLIASERTMAGQDRLVVMFHLLCVTSAVVIVLSLTLVEPHWPAGTFGWLAFAGSTICFVLATFFLFTAVDLIGPLRTAVIDNSSPIWVILFAALLLGEVLSGRQLLGAGLVVAAVLALQLLQRPRPAKPTTPSARR